MSVYELPHFAVPPPNEGRSETRRRRNRQRLSAILLALSAVVLILTIVGVDGPFRFVLGLAFGLFAPGWSIVGLLDLKIPPLEIGLSVAVSLALIMVAAQLMMTWHLWHPVTLEELLCAACGVSLAYQAWGRRGRRRTSS